MLGNNMLGKRTTQPDKETIVNSGLCDSQASYEIDSIVASDNQNEARILWQSKLTRRVLVQDIE